MKERIKDFYMLFKHLASVIHLIIPIGLFICFVSSLDIFVPFAYKIVIDKILVLKDIYLLNLILLITLGIITAKSFLGFVQSILVALSKQYFINNLFIKLVDKIQKSAIKELNKFDAGDIVSRIITALTVLHFFYIHIITFVFKSLFTMGVVIFFMYYYNPLLLLLSLLFIPMHLINYFYFYNKMNNATLSYYKHNSKINNIVYDVIRGIEDIKINNLRNFFIGIFKKSSINAQHQFHYEMYYFSIQYSIQNFLIAVTNIFIISAGVYLFYGKNISLGDLLFFLFLVAFFNEPISTFSIVNNSLNQGINAVKRLEEVSNISNERDEGTIELDKQIIDKLEIKSVFFGYNKTSIINNLNMEFKKNKIYGLVGKSGCGKTTLFKLLLHLYSVDKGKIFLDEYEIRDITLKSLRDHINYVPQELFLFQSTIKENLKFANEDASDEDIYLACKLAALDRFIENQPDKIETFINFEGSNLSGGEKQRMTLARAFLKESPIIIMDETTSALDYNTESMLLNNLHKMKKDKIIIMISHRKSTLQKLDYIYVLSNGKVCENGNYDELINKKSYFYNEFLAELE